MRVPSGDHESSWTDPSAELRVNAVQLPVSGFMTATCVSSPTKARKAKVWPSGEMRGCIANSGPPSHVPDHDGGEGAVAGRRFATTAANAVMRDSRSVRQDQ